MTQTYYEILGVSVDATTGEIEAAFKSRAGEVHPDRVSSANPYLRSIVAEAFKNLSEAKAVLVDVGKRQKYDADLTASRGSSAGPSRGAASARAHRNADSAATVSRSLFALGIVFAAILLAGGIALYRSKPVQVPAPTQTTTRQPAVNPPVNQSSRTKEGPHGTTVARPGNGEPRLPAPGFKGGKSQAIVLWRASEPPDLSGLNPSERQTIEEACSYAKLMEGPEAYNGCLLKELTARGHGISDQH